MSHYVQRKRPGNCTCSVDEGAGTSNHWESCSECRVLVEDNSLDVGTAYGVDPTKLGNMFEREMNWKYACKKNSLTLPDENEICEIGAHLRDGGLRVSNADVGTILAHFIAIRNKPEISQAAKRAIECLQGCTLTPADADEIVKELGYVTHGWTGPIRKNPS